MPPSEHELRLRQRLGQPMHDLEQLPLLGRIRPVERVEREFGM